MTTDDPYTVIDGRGAMSVFEIYIKTTPERLWEAITDPRDAGQVLASGSGSSPTGRRAPPTAPCSPGRGRRSPRARTSRSSRRTGSCRRSRRCGATRSSPWAVAGHLGDRAGRRLLPAAGHPRPPRGRRQQRALRRLADDPLGPQDAARDRRAARHPGLAAVRRGERLAQLSKPSPARSSARSQTPRRPARRSAAASRLRVSSIAAQRRGSGGNGSGFDRIAASAVASVARPSSRSSATPAPNRLAPTPSPVCPTV